jgi:hypothetical protein
MKAKWIASAILVWGLMAPAFAQVGQEPAILSEISPVAALPDASRAVPFPPMGRQMAIATLTAEA